MTDITKHEWRMENDPNYKEGYLHCLNEAKIWQQSQPTQSQGEQGEGIKTAEQIYNDRIAVGGNMHFNNHFNIIAMAEEYAEQFKTEPVKMWEWLQSLKSPTPQTESEGGGEKPL